MTKQEECDAKKEINQKCSRVKRFNNVYSHVTRQVVVDKVSGIYRILETSLNYIVSGN